MKINCGLKSPTALRKVESEGTEAVSMRELRAIFFATPGPHLRSGYALTAMRAGCRASHWKRGGDYNMFTRITKAGGHQYHQLVESFRNDRGKVRTHVVANLGPITGKGTESAVGIYGPGRGRKPNWSGVR